MASIQKPPVHSDGSFGGGASAADTGKECRGSRVVPYSTTPDSNGSSTSMLGFAPFASSRTSSGSANCGFRITSVHRYDIMPLPGFGVPYAPRFEFTLTPLPQLVSPSSGSQGTTSAPHQVNGAGSYNGKFVYISLMPSYKDKSHEQLSFEDYGLNDKGGKSSSSCVESSGTPSNRTAENTASLSTSDLIKLSQSSSGLAAVEFTGQDVNRQLNLSTQFPVEPNAATSKGHGISSLQFISKPDKKEISSGPVAPLQPRESPRDWVNFSVQNAKCNSGPVQISNQHEHDVAARKTDDVVALLPKLPDGGYYTEPSLQKLAAKEMEEAGFCRHVNEFVVGRQGYGSIKFVGETDVRHLDIKSIVQFNHREVIVYPDGSKKPGVGQELKKAAEVTLVNVKCISRKTGKQYVEGHRVESYRELLMNKSAELGFEFVSYDPVEGEWKFRVQHF